VSFVEAVWSILFKWDAVLRSLMLDVFSWSLAWTSLGLPVAPQETEGSPYVAAFSERTYPEASAASTTDPMPSAGGGTRPSPRRVTARHVEENSEGRRVQVFARRNRSHGLL